MKGREKANYVSFDWVESQQINRWSHSIFFIYLRLEVDGFNVIFTWVAEQKGKTYLWPRDLFRD